MLILIKTIRQILLILFILSSTTSLSYSQSKHKVKADKQIPIDKSNNKISKVPNDKITRYKEDNSFNYFYKEPEGFDFWSLIKRWLYEFIQGFFSDKGAAPFIRYALTFIAIAFIIYKIVGGNLSSIFTGNKKMKGANGFNYYEEDIYQENLDEKLKKAITKKEYRAAIRFYYLSLLKKLDEERFIKWELGKTNSEYQREIENKDLLRKFIALSNAYEYSWYGHFDVTENSFLKWQKDFEKVFENIS